MADNNDDRDRLGFRILTGSLFGLLGAFVTIEFPTIGLVLIGVTAIWSGSLPPRYAQLAALLSAAGAFWLYVFIGAVGTCSSSPASCSGPPPEPFVVVAGAVLAGGLASAELTRHRLRRHT